MSELMNNSIFSGEANSVMGNWRNKEISITYISFTLKGGIYNIKFLVKAKGLEENDATININEEDDFIITKSLTKISKKEVKIYNHKDNYIEISAEKSKIEALWEIGVFEFRATLKSNNLTAISEEFPLIQEPKILDVYFAKKEETDFESDKKRKYTFNHPHTQKTDKTKQTLAASIYNLIKTLLDKDKQITTIDKIKSVIKDEHKKGDVIEIPLLEKGIVYKKIENASIGNQLYLIAETQGLEDEEVKVKIHEKEDSFKILKTKNSILPVMVFDDIEDKTANEEASGWITVDIKNQEIKKGENGALITKKDGDFEVGIKKIQLRPEKYKMANESEAAEKNFEGWNESLLFRENETETVLAAKKALEQKAKDREEEKFITLKYDEKAEIKSKPSVITSSEEGRKVEAGKDIVYNITSYEENYTEDDKNNVRWSLWIRNTKGIYDNYIIIDEKSKKDLYTYAKIEIDKLTIVFDEELAGSQVQIEPYRDKPKIKQTKEISYAVILTKSIKEAKVETKPEPKVLKRETTKLWINAECKACKKEEQKKRNFYKEKGFELTSLDTIYIFHDGKISNTPLKLLNKIRYVYVDKEGEEHDMGMFDLIEKQKWVRGVETLEEAKGGIWQTVTVGDDTRYYKKDGSKKTFLLTPFSGNQNKVFKYKKGSFDLAMYEDTSREYFNPISFATIIGALFEVNFKDIVSNGSVGIDGTGAPSRTHINGFNMDFKYLRKDKKKGGIEVDRIEVQDIKLDIERQNKFLDALNKFGWGENSKNLSNKTHKGKDLNHCKSKDDHKNHLHLQGFKPKYK